jgi:hypothetical protein
LNLFQRADVHVDGAASTLNVAGEVSLRASSRLTATSGAQVFVGSHFLFDNTVEAEVNLDAAIVKLASGDMQFLEVGGEDLGINGAVAGNFGIGQLVVGADGSPTMITLLDVLDNGNRLGGNEALYLYGLGGPDGLVINAGSSLVINNLNVYAFLDGAMTHLNAMFGPMVNEIPLGAGTLMLLPEPPLLGDTNKDGRVDIDDLNNVRNNFGSMAPPYPLGDTNLDGKVDVDDLNNVRNNFGAVAAAVPEPGAVVLLFGSCLALCGSGRRRPRCPKT